MDLTTRHTDKAGRVQLVVKKIHVHTKKITTGRKIACVRLVLQDVIVNRLLFPEVINSSLGLILYQGSPQENQDLPAKINQHEFMS